MNTDRIIDIRTITADGPSIHFTATPTEREELAKRFNVTHVDTFEVTGRFGRDDLITFDGILHIIAERECVATLNPFSETTEAPVHLLFAEEKSMPPDDPTIDVLPVHRGKIHLFDVFAEEFGLALPSFPKSINTWTDYHDPDDTPADNPFAVLKNLKK